MRVVIALGGNAISSPDGAARPEDQRDAIERDGDISARDRDHVRDGEVVPVEAEDRYRSTSRRCSRYHAESST